jgi:nicotinamidase-related amidase
MLFKLLVIDMQNDFIASAGLVGRSGRDVSAAQKLAEYLPDFIAAARRAGVLVTFIRNIYSTERNFFYRILGWNRRRASNPAATPVIFVLMCWRTTLSITLISTPSFAPMRFAPLF